MLVLSRREGERIVLNTRDGEIIILVTKVKGKSAKLGIEAPTEVRILREELREAAKPEDVADSPPLAPTHSA